MNIKRKLQTDVNIYKENVGEVQISPFLESQQEFEMLGETKNDEKLSKLFSNKIYQFKFDDETMMALPVLGLDMKIAINWHIDNTNNLEEFLQSIKDFVKKPISDYNIERLTKIYENSTRNR